MGKSKIQSLKAIDSRETKLNVVGSLCRPGAHPLIVISYRRRDPIVRSSRARLSPFSVKADSQGDGRFHQEAGSELSGRPSPSLEPSQANASWFMHKIGSAAEHCGEKNPVRGSTVAAIAAWRPRIFGRRADETGRLSRPTAYFWKAVQTAEWGTALGQTWGISPCLLPCDIVRPHSLAAAWRNWPDPSFRHPSKFPPISSSPLCGSSSLNRIGSFLPSISLPG